MVQEAAKAQADIDGEVLTLLKSLNTKVDALNSKVERFYREFETMDIRVGAILYILEHPHDGEEDNANGSVSSTHTLREVSVEDPDSE